ncbi:polyprenyl synthetase family protein [Pseudactinotalea sp. Z1739]|uniref:polyprenyl synthetase family protein n=1 Tax=Pseudactinotalea sp. Z1739 TaxID=3413028 RepID=UPI003C7CBDDD
MTTTPLPLGDPDVDATIGAELAAIEERLIEMAQYNEPLIEQASEHLIAAGGKRMRPALVLLTSLLGEGVDDRVRQAALATELTHLATLYHDDVMDSAPLRRGAPSAHEVWGNTMAILTGDLLFARASRLVSELGPVAVRIQADAFERLVLGQMHETLGPREGQDPIEHYLGVLADKTGSLIAAAARYGTYFSGADEQVQAAAVAYGEKVGVAFQLADDVIDLSADADTTGKTPGTDLREGVATMPVLLLQARGEGLDAEGRAILTALQGDLSDDDALDEVVQRLRTHEVTEEVRVLARRWAADAVADLEPVADSTARRALETFATLLVDRLA